MDFYIPSDTGEFLAFCAAVFAFAIGVLGLLAPRLALRMSGLALHDGTADGLASARSLGGFHAGLALAAIMLAQNWTYLAMGGAFALAAFGRVLSTLSDRSFSLRNMILLLVQTVLAGLPLLYVFGLI